MALSLQEQMRLIKQLDEQNKLVGAKGIGEALFNTIGQTAATSASGLGGLWDLITGGDINSAVDTVNSVQKAGQSLLPELSPQGQKAMSNAQQVFEPVGQFLQESGKNAGDMVFDWTGSPLAATAVQTGVQGLPELVGLGAVTKPRIQSSGMPASLLDEPVIPNSAPTPTNLLGVPQPKLPPPQPKLPAPLQRPPRFEEAKAAPSINPMDKPAQVNKPDAQLPPELRPREMYTQPSEYGIKSNLHQSLLDLMGKEGVKDTVNGAWLHKQLNGRGVTDQELIESGANMKDLTGTNKVNLFDFSKSLDTPAQNLLFDTQFGEGGISSERYQDYLSSWDESNSEIMPFDEYVGYDYTDTLDNAFDHPDSYATELLANRIINSSGNEFNTIEEAMPVARSIVQENEYNWNGIVDAVEPLGSDIASSLEDAIVADAAEMYNSYNPVREWNFTDPQGNEIQVSGSDDLGYRIWVDGHDITLNRVPYSLDEAMVQTQEWTGVSDSDFGDVDYAEWLRGEPNDIFENVIAVDPKSDWENPKHFHDYKGYVAHSRATGRTGVNGENIYFVDEIQSDRHQMAREKGGYHTEDQAKQAKLDYETIDADLYDLKEAYEYNRDDIYHQMDIGDLEKIYNTINPNTVLSEYEKSSAQALEGSIKREIMNFAQRPSDLLYRLDKDTYNRLLVQYGNDKSLFDIATSPDAMKVYEDKLPLFKDELEYRKERSELIKKREKANARKDMPPEAALKDDKWISAMVRNSIVRAIEHGKDGVSFSNSLNQINQWSDRYSDLYKKTYDEKIPAALKRLGKQYGAEVKQIKIDDPELGKEGVNWYLEISPEMRKAIKDKGIDLYGKVEDGLLKKPQNKYLQGGLMDGAQYA